MALKCFLLSPRGFCSGVTRAVNMATQSLKLYGKIYIIEDVIHNKMFMKGIMAGNVIKAASIEDIPDNATVMFSAHGTLPKIAREAENKGLTVIDGTCSIVQELQKAVSAAAAKGHKIIIIGDKAHPEVASLVGYADSKDVFVVTSDNDVKALPDFANSTASYFTQTTVDYRHAERIIALIKEKIPHVSSDSQISVCNAVRERQEMVRKIAPTVDLFIVLGSEHSSNCARLAEIAKSVGTKNVVMADSKDDLDLKIFDGISTVAIASAVSCNERLVDELATFLAENLGASVEKM